MSQFLLSAIGSLPVSAYRIWVGVDCLEPRIVLMMARQMMFSFSMFGSLVLSYQAVANFALDEAFEQ